MKLLRWIEDQILFKLQRRCDHPGRMVSVDILEGSSDLVATRYCNRCGAVALDYNGTPAEWRRPDPNLWFCWKQWKLENRWDDTTSFACPWFAFFISFGGYDVHRHAMVWGFRLWWSPMAANGPASMFARKFERIFAYTRPRYERQLDRPTTKLSAADTSSSTTIVVGSGKPRPGEPVLLVDRERVRFQ